MNKSTWREQVVSIPAGVVTPVTFRDTNPNAFVIQNRSNERVYVALTPNVSASNYSLIVAAYAVRKLIRPDAVEILYLYAVGGATVFIGSLEVAFDISLVGETQEIAEYPGGLGTVNVQTIIDPLPAGTNNIGDVDIASALPAGNNNIGDVDIASVPKGSKTWAGQATTDTYADLGTPWDVSNLKNKTIVILNTGANDALVKVLGSVDNGVSWDIEVLAETSVAAGAKTDVKVNDYYTTLKIQIKAATPGSQTTVEARGGGIA